MSGLGRGKVDYRTYQIKPQRNMHWTRAIQFMLQNSGNIVVGQPFKYYAWMEPKNQSYAFRISEGVIQYTTFPFQKDIHDIKWANAVSHDFNYIKGFDALELVACEPSSATSIASLSERIDVLDAALTVLINGKGKK